MLLGLKEFVVFGFETVNAFGCETKSEDEDLVGFKALRCRGDFVYKVKMH